MGKTLHNTETHKDMKYVEAKLIQGEQQLLFEMLENGKFSMNEISKDSKISDKKLDQLMLEMGFKTHEIRALKTKV